MFNNIILSVMAWTTNTVGFFVTRIREERGQDLIEYAVLAGAIAIAAGGALYFFLGSDGFDTFTGKIAACLSFDESGCFVN